MSRLKQLAPESTTGAVRQTLDAIGSKLGLVPNLTRALANSPAALNAYAQLSGALARGQLPGKIREQISLTVAQANECDYCLAAHSAIGRRVGLSDEQVHRARLGESDDPPTDAVLRFTRQVVGSQGRVSDEELQAFRDAGYDDGAVAEVVANVALNVLTNYFNNVAHTDIDFPKAAELTEAVA